MYTCDTSLPKVTKDENGCHYSLDWNSGLATLRPTGALALPHQPLWPHHQDISLSRDSTYNSCTIGMVVLTYL